MTSDKEYGKDAVKIKELETKAEKGDLDCFYELGKYYFSLLLPNYDKAIGYWEKGAEKGHAGCISFLANYYTSYYVDDEKAFMYWGKYAQKGYEEGIFRVGIAYYKGVGVAQNYEKALGYFEKLKPEHIKQPLKDIIVEIKEKLKGKENER